MENNFVRVTKAQKLTALKEAIRDDFSKTFPGDEEKGRFPYVFNTAEVMAFIDAELALLAKKNSGDKKQTADQKKNEEYKVDIVNFLSALPEGCEGATCTEMFKKIPSMDSYSPQKVAALCRQLREEGKVDSKEVKGKTLFFAL